MEMVPGLSGHGKIALIHGKILPVLSKEELNHELIHTAQARELLYIPFYLWYIIEWFFLFLRYQNWMWAYYNIRFEKEAYAHQEDLEYLNRRKHYCYR